MPGDNLLRLVIRRPSSYNINNVIPKAAAKIKAWPFRRYRSPADDRSPSESSTYPLFASQLIARKTEKSEKIVVLLGVSTSQTLLVILAAFSLLVLTALLWMNHRTSVTASPLVVLQQAGVLCPVDSVSRHHQAHARQLPARAPPTIPWLPIPNARPSKTVDDSAEVFR
jgi:hypothetical protein